MRLRCPSSSSAPGTAAGAESRKAILAAGASAIAWLVWPEARRLRSWRDRRRAERTRRPLCAAARAGGAKPRQGGARENASRPAADTHQARPDGRSSLRRRPHGPSRTPTGRESATKPSRRDSRKGENGGGPSMGIETVEHEFQRSLSEQVRLVAEDAGPLPREHAVRASRTATT